MAGPCCNMAVLIPSTVVASTVVRIYEWSSIGQPLNTNAHYEAHKAEIGTNAPWG